MLTTLQSFNDIIQGRTLREPRPEQLDTDCFKFAEIGFVRQNSNEYVNYVLDNIPIVGNRKHVLVDVKVHHLQEGEYPALKHWHIDCVNNPLSSLREEYNHIFVSGQWCLTEFLACRIDIDITPDQVLNFDSILPDGISTKRILGNTIYTYGRAVHRAVPSIKDHSRLLIRVSESDQIRPINKRFEVTYRR